MPEFTLSLLGDAVSIAALSIMGSVSWNAWRRIPSDVNVPMKFDRQGEPSWLLTKKYALTLPVVLALGLLLLPVIMNPETGGMTGDEQLMMFAMRAMLAGAFAVVHVVTVKAALDYLNKNGKLLP